MKIHANNIAINYMIEGVGPWITLSHSLACDLHMWDAQMAALTPHYRVLRYDTRGHGASDVPAGPYTLEQLADDLRALLDALNIDKTHFAGLSMGGMIGQTFALKTPDRFISLALCDTTSAFPPGAGKMWDERIALAREKGMAAHVDGTLARWFTDSFRAARPDVIERIAATIRATPVEGYAGCGHAIAAINLTDSLCALSLPALVLVGAEDPGTPVAMAQAMHAAIKGSELAIIPRAAHLSNIEQADRFNEILLEFLSRAARER